MCDPHETETNGKVTGVQEPFHTRTKKKKKDEEEIVVSAISP